jgi:predicted RNA-binding Zn ribbon-like protein
MNASLTSLRLPLRLGGNLALDFANTAAHRDSERRREYLTSYAYLLAWCWHENLVSHEGVARFQQIATAIPSTADAALASALRLREAIFGVFSAYIDGETPSAENTNCLQAAVGTALAHRHLALESG